MSWNKDLVKHVPEVRQYGAWFGFDKGDEPTLKQVLQNMLDVLPFEVLETKFNDTDMTFVYKYEEELFPSQWDGFVAYKVWHKGIVEIKEKDE